MKGSIERPRATKSKTEHRNPNTKSITMNPVLCFAAGAASAMLLILPAVADDEQKPSSVAEAIRLVAPESFRIHMQPGDGFHARLENEPPQWDLESVTAKGSDDWEFAYRSTSPLTAACSVALDRDHAIAVWQVTLTNTSNTDSTSVTEIFPFFLRLHGLRKPQVISSRGAGEQGKSFAMRYPTECYSTQVWDLEYPQGVSFTSGAAAYRRTGSSTQNLPIFIVHEAAAQADGPGMFFGLEWSTNWDAHIAFEDTPHNLRLAIAPRVNRLRLDAGESVQLPAAHLGFFTGGFEAGSNACRRCIHQRLMPQYMGQPTMPPVTYHLWPGIMAPYTDQSMRPHVDVAAHIGVERFCLDVDWWIDNFHHGLGNWQVDRKKNSPTASKPSKNTWRRKGWAWGSTSTSRLSPTHGCRASTRSITIRCRPAESLLK